MITINQTIWEPKRRNKIELRFGYVEYSVFDILMGYQVEITSKHLGR